MPPMPWRAAGPGQGQVDRAAGWPAGGDSHRARLFRGIIVILSAGASVPADCLLLEAKDVYVERGDVDRRDLPGGKDDGPCARRHSPGAASQRPVHGHARRQRDGRAVVVRIGRSTEFGRISQRLRTRPPETEFERGLRHFGYFLMEVTFLLVIGIFVVNTYFHRPVLEALLFSLALAVGLTPQLLPAIVSVNLAHGDREMAKQKVIVKRLSSIENFGSMNLLCSDKTGTLTRGTGPPGSRRSMPRGSPATKTRLYAYLNASFETGFVNPIDEAIRAVRQAATSAAYTKLDEVPYDFIRKRLSILVSQRRQERADLQGRRAEHAPGLFPG